MSKKPLVYDLRQTIFNRVRELEEKIVYQECEKYFKPLLGGEIKISASRDGNSSKEYTITCNCNSYDPPIINIIKIGSFGTVLITSTRASMKLHTECELKDAWDVCDSFRNIITKEKE